MTQHLVQQVPTQPHHVNASGGTITSNVSQTAYQTVSYLPVTELHPHQTYTFEPAELHDGMPLYHSVPSRQHTRGLSRSLLESPCGTGEFLRHKHVNAKALETTDMRLDTPIHQGATRMRGRRLHLNDRRAGNHCPSIPPLTPAQAVQLPGATPGSSAEKAGTQSTKGSAQKGPHYPRCRIKTSSRSFRRSMPTVTGA